MLYVHSFVPVSEALIVLVKAFNKVAGVYGLIAVLTGAGGSAAQLTMYIYSVLGLIALVWGLKAVGKVGDLCVVNVLRL